MNLKNLLSTLLTEAPLPDDWDSGMFSERVPFKKRVEYAKQRAAQIGKGSSRVAFEIPYEGRKTVLKIAMNSKGMAQNEEEVRLLDDNHMQQIGNVIPLIDYDEQNSSPTWIHTEYASKLTQKQLEKYFDGISMDKITYYLDHLTGNLPVGYGKVSLPDEIFENENYQKLEELVGNFGLPAGDFARKANWGLYKGRPVIIDMGFTNETAKLYR